jgi:hypothetical protein
MGDAKGVAALLVLLVGAGLAALLLPALLLPPSEVASPWVGPWIWEVRVLDVLIQALILLAGVLGILHLVGQEGGA